MKSSRTDRKGGPGGSGGIAGIGDLRRPEEECGLFGIYGLSDAATHTAADHNSAITIESGPRQLKGIDRPVETFAISRA